MSRESGAIQDDPVKASAALNEQYHYLTASVYSQIVALEKQGDHAGAVRLATEQYADAINERTPKILENLSYWERAYNAVAKAADGLKNTGRRDINADIESARHGLLEAENMDGWFQNQKSKDALIAFRRERLELLEKEKAEQEASAKWEREQAEAQSAAVSSMEKVDTLAKSFWSNEQKRTAAIKDYKKQLEDIRKVAPDDPRLAKATIEKNIANINAKYKDPKGATTPVDLTGFNDSKNSLTSILSEYKNHQKELDAALKAGIISQESYASQREAIIEQQKGEVTGAYEAEIAALEAVKGKASTSAAQRIQLDQKIADARVNMVKAQKDADSELAVLATNEEGRLRKQALAVQTYTSALEQQVSTLRLQGQRSAEGLGLGDRQRSLQDQQNSIADRTNQQKLDLANQYGDGSRGMSLDEYNQKLAALDKTQRDLQQTAIANYNDMTAAQGSWSAGASSAFQNYLESARDVAGQTKALFGNTFSSLEDAVANFAISGKFAFSDFTKAVLADMARIATRQAASGLLSTIAGSALGSWFGGAGGAATSAGSTQAGYSPQFMDNFVSGQRAAGGPVAANSLYQVNELGPELLNQGGKTYLMMGAEGGSITPLGVGPVSAAAAAGGSGAGVGANMNITINIARDGEAAVSADTALGQQLAPQLVQLIRSEIAANERKTLSPSGGATWRAMQGRR
ncbi:MAG: phage tail tape measure protein [Pseudomonas palmensis]|uniref:phage tail tape measure protein n=1 Tax=Pseudomonas palmensis TaxID=2815362 RepID=UPI003D0D96A0